MCDTAPLSISCFLQCQSSPRYQMLLLWFKRDSAYGPRKMLAWDNLHVSLHAISTALDQSRET